MDSRNFIFMFYGFLVAWLVLVVYVLSMVGRERKLRRELDSVKNMLEK
jgi:CcmD family protein